MKYEQLIQKAITQLNTYREKPAAFYENASLKEANKKLAKTLSEHLALSLRTRGKHIDIDGVIAYLNEALAKVRHQREEIKSSASLPIFKAGKGALETLIEELITSAQTKNRFLAVKDNFISALRQKAQENSDLHQPFSQLIEMMQEVDLKDFDADKFSEELRSKIIESRRTISTTTFQEVIQPYVAYIFEDAGPFKNAATAAAAAPKEGTELQENFTIKNHY
jgi:hypothetical protein